MIKATYGVLARVFAIVLIVVGAAAIFWRNLRPWFCD
ncbi:hypothetical protein CIP107569_01226 [Corynebacterium diphtheriae]|nr:hypothetical protein FRC061569_00989 [Corynebacterium diphtheriae]CAB0508887.1 hypothetical protein FRC020322_01231 [Corynebacterium diphtheriae]CAB0509112.1 hypothetical protein FRC031641_01228 [Corynebacterium diphtheriae]CAB0509342.1 hypothetical protein FRC020338_01227 [Corynebacterium diphtheriae]CAB0551473.1 hypothetical protein CIP107522_01116 [Corynebacterium diphtheriae]